MQRERWQQINQLWDAALDREADRRASFLTKACVGDKALLREMESLLAAQQQAEGFMDAPPAAAAAELLADDRVKRMAGRTLSHYRLLSLLGAGGMGEVYLAQDTLLDRPAALKLLPAHVTKDEDRVRRFHREARAVSILNHPNILTIYEIGSQEGAHFIATEFIDGETLRDHLARTRPNASKVLHMFIQVAGALTAAHQAGITHRDIKPENIMIRRDGYVKVLDFGLAKLTESAVTGVEPRDPARLMVDTDPGVRMGTANYMSPEQTRGLVVDARTDIFSFGVMLYEALTTRLPFEGQTNADVAAAILKEQPPPLKELAPEAPAQLQAIVSKALSKDVDARYQTSEALLADLLCARNQFIQGDPGGLNLTTDLGGPPSPARKDRRAAATLFATKFLASRLRLRTPASFAAFLIIAITLLATGHFLKSEPPTRSVAVLPFRALDPGSSDPAFALGMADALITRLGNIRRITVLPTDAIRKYAGRDQDPAAAGRELNVEAVLSGAIHTSPERVWVNVRLVDVASGAVLFAGAFDEKSTDIFAVQDSIFQQATSALNIELTGKEKRQLVKRDTNDLEAYKLFMQGRSYWHTQTQEGLKRCTDYFLQAAKADPNYALAYSGLASAYLLLGIHGFSPPREIMPQAEEMARRALQLDETLAEAHTVLALVKARYYWDLPAAEREFQMGFELNPRLADGHLAYALCLADMGRFDEARGEVKQAEPLDPESPFIRPIETFIEYLSRQYDRVIEVASKTLEIKPNSYSMYQHMGQAYVQKGMFDQAIAAFQKARTLSGGSIFAIEMLGNTYARAGKKEEAQQVLEQLEGSANRELQVACVYIGMGELDLAFGWLDKACQARSSELIHLKVNPLYDSIRSDPRFADLLRRTGPQRQT